MDTEIKACGEVLTKITGHAPHLFRPPGGEYNKGVAESVEALGYKMILYSDDPGDYANPGWFKHPKDTVAYELDGPPPETPRQRGAGAAAMPAQNMPAKNIEVHIRKPAGGHSGH